MTESFSKLGLQNKPVIVHASMKSIGYVNGGAETVADALVESFAGVIAPTHTYKTMVIPMEGPSNNGLTYGRYQNLNRMAKFFHIDMPADPLMGAIPEALRRRSDSRRTNHPILSFTGVNAVDVLATQDIGHPLAPIGALAEQGGWVLLLGVDHNVNTSIHYAELLAGRKQFVRWALTHAGVVECAGFPGCSQGFHTIDQQMEPWTRITPAGNAWIKAVPLENLFESVIGLIRNDPLALLCQRDDCERCSSVRSTVQAG